MAPQLCCFSRFSDQEAEESDFFLVSLPSFDGPQDDSGRKMINEYVRERIIGSGSYAKVV